MVQFILEFVRTYPELVVALIALLLAVMGIGIAKAANTRTYYQNLENDSLYQINENLKDIERILNSPLYEGSSVSLQSVIDGAIDKIDSAQVIKCLSVLSTYFSAFCASLDKYSDNILNRKGFCFKFQEYGVKARKINDLFKKFGFKNVSLEFSRLHMKSAGILDDES